MAQSVLEGSVKRLRPCVGVDDVRQGGSKLEGSVKKKLRSLVEVDDLMQGEE
tara:strand:+ start:24024 stop:24179 length:156 start_codon:yes stop_codon:yes gene_type:complete